MHVEIISGSARVKRKSNQVALYLQSVLEEKTTVSASLLDVRELNFPMLDYTYKEHPNPPDSMKSFSDRILKADAIIIVSPEHNGSYSGAIKNTMDYFYKEYAGKPFGLVTVSNGSLGGISALRNLQQYCITLRGYVAPQGLLTPRVGELFENGRLIDESFEKKVRRFTNSFMEFVESFRPKQ